MSAKHKLRLPAPIEEWSHEQFEAAQCRFFVKREDLIHPEFGGNKWRKLKYNLEEAKRRKATLVTAGGAYSNHIAATAAVCRHAQVPCIGLIRGEELHPQSNRTLAEARAKGMQLLFLSRDAYRALDEDNHHIHHRADPAFFVPEGGANVWGRKGCGEVMDELTEDYDYIATACGTGTTLQAMTTARPQQAFVGVPVLRAREHFEQLAGTDQVHWCFEAHWGGYAKWGPELRSFAHALYDRFGLPTDPIYTAKLFYALFQEIKAGRFPAGSRILAIHTGGLQGIAGWEARHQLSWLSEGAV